MTDIQNKAESLRCEKNYIKAYTLNHLCKHIREAYGTDKLEQIAQRVPASIQDFIAHPLLPSTKVRHESYYELLDAAVTLLFDGDPKGAFDLSYGMTQKDINQIFTFVLRYTSPKLLFKMTPLIWSSYTDVGSISVHFASDQTIHMQANEMIVATDLAAYDFAGGAVAFLESSRAKNCNLIEIYSDKNSFTAVIEYH